VYGSEDFESPFRLKQADAWLLRRRRRDFIHLCRQNGRRDQEPSSHSGFNLANGVRAAVPLRRRAIRLNGILLLSPERRRSGQFPIGHNVAWYHCDILGHALG
jgi:hypothetical protein